MAKIKDYRPTDDECVAACVLYMPGWEQADTATQEQMILEARRWLLVWGNVLQEMERH